MSATQMNLRIDAQTKERGDAALAQAGYSPTQAVRAIWTFAAAHVHDPQAVKNLLLQAEPESDYERETRKAAKRAVLKRCGTLCEQLASTVGPSVRQGLENVSDKEVRDGARWARWEERGLL